LAASGPGHQTDGVDRRYRQDLHGNDPVQLLAERLRADLVAQQMLRRLRPQRSAQERNGQKPVLGDTAGACDGCTLVTLKRPCGQRMTAIR
jgi:hypothetical protein